jgi:hypothetical protein
MRLDAIGRERTRVDANGRERMQLDSVVSDEFSVCETVAMRQYALGGQKQDVKGDAKRGIYCHSIFTQIARHVANL